MVVKEFVNFVYFFISSDFNFDGLYIYSIRERLRNIISYILESGIVESFW